MSFFSLDNFFLAARGFSIMPTSVKATLEGLMKDTTKHDDDAFQCLDSIFKHVNSKFKTSDAVTLSSVKFKYNEIVKKFHVDGLEKTSGFKKFEEPMKKRATPVYYEHRHICFESFISASSNVPEDFKLYATAHIWFDAMKKQRKSRSRKYIEQDAPYGINEHRGEER